MLHHVHVHVNPRVRVLSSRMQMILVIIPTGTNVVDDGLETLFAEWTFWLYFGPLYKTVETELMLATVSK
jgi:hypothetical protein